MIKYNLLLSDISVIISEAKRVIEAEDNVIFAYLFGSIASGKLKPLSDLDIAVYLRKIKKIAEYKLELFHKITDAIKTNELDLVILNTDPIFLTGRILQNKQVLVDKDPSLRFSFESLMLRKFFDFKIKEEKYFLLRYGIA